MSLKGDEGKRLSESLLRSFFQTQDYPFTRHHIDSFDQFLAEDIRAVIAAQNPFVILHDQIGTTGAYKYKAEIFIGGLKGDQLFIGTPVLNTKAGEIKTLYPNEARLRNMTYASTVQANIVIRVIYGAPISKVVLMDPVAEPQKYGYLANFPLFKIPILLHSRYCILHNKSREFLRDVGECPNDYGGYFIVDGAEKVLVTLQETAFNTLYIRRQPSDPKVDVYGNISCLNPKTRSIKMVAFSYLRKKQTIEVTLPFIRAPVPLFVLFRALGVQSDEDILRLIFPNPTAPEVKILEPLLDESIQDAHPYYDTFTAIQYMKVLTKGFSVAHVLEILHNQCFSHIEYAGGGKQAFLAECVRKLLRVIANIDQPTDRDDIRNQRCLTSGTLCRFLFQRCYLTFKKAAILAIDREYNLNTSIYGGTNYENLFLQGNMSRIMKKEKEDLLTDSIMRGFKGKWGSGLGEEKSGVLQSLSRLSYLDFLSHCRRCVLDFDTTMKLPSPRRLHTSQFGYFCTNETPGGASIGITKNLTMLTAISTFTDPAPFIAWLYARGGVMPCDEVTADTMSLAVPVFVNSGIVGYTLRPIVLRDACKVMKWTGFLPASASITFSIREKQVHFYLDEGRPLRPVIHLDPKGTVPVEALTKFTKWRDFIFGSAPGMEGRQLSDTGFIDPFAGRETAELEEYITALYKYRGCIEYIDPYEGNEAYIACFVEHITPETSHLEVHPSSIAGLLVSMIPFANHNQSPRNQLSSSQSKQSVSVFATNYRNRFDGQTHVLCYGEAPLSRTLYYDYVAEGQNPYGHNLVLAMGCFTGYNQEDGIVMNADAFQRGLYRNITFRSYETFEEDDLLTGSKTRIANPIKVPGWTALRPGVDYSKLDDRGIVREGSFVDENTVIVGKYLQSPAGDMVDASLTAQVWTSGRVEKISVTVDNQGHALVKIRVIQDRTPELGDKFSNRHGQKGTLGMMIRGHDMPRTAGGLVPDMLMNPHAIPSRMTIAQLIEALMGKLGVRAGAIANATMFMNDGDPTEQIRAILRDQFGMEPYGEEILYDGTTGCMIPSTIFVGNVYTMRLKHMTEDKWNARAEGRKEQRTHQPTGGRGNQGGLKIGEMDRDAIVAHGVTGFLQESFMKRSDGAEFVVCNSCGTIPIYNTKQNLYICSMCDGPVKYVGDNANNLEILQPSKRSQTTFSRVAMPYTVKLLDQELAAYLNIGMRYATGRDFRKLRAPALVELTEAERRNALTVPLPTRVLPESVVPEILRPVENVEARPEDLANLGVPSEEAEAPAEVPAPAPEPTVPVVPAPAPAAPVNQVTAVPMMMMPVMQAAPAPANNLQEVDFDELPLTEEVPPQPAPQPVMQFGGAMPVMILQPAVPGAPPTITVDTQGVDAQPTPAPAAPRRARSPRRAGAAATGGAAPAPAPAQSHTSSHNVKVTINKMG
jgi:DNA-directed RNA polymerase II subunit RPB2